MVSIFHVIASALRREAVGMYPNLTEEDIDKIRSMPEPKRISPQKSKEFPDIEGQPKSRIPNDVSELAQMLRGFRVNQNQRRLVIDKLKSLGEAGVLADAYLAGGYTRGGGTKGVMATRKKPLDPDTRAHLISALGAIKGKEGDKAIIKALDDQSAQVREIALKAVANKDLKDAADEVALMLSKSGPGIQRAAVEALGALGVKSDGVVKAIESFIKAKKKEHTPGTSTQSGSGALAIAGIKALGEIGGSSPSGKIKDILEEYARSPEEGFAMAAARYLPKKERPKKEEGLTKEEEEEAEAEMMVHASITERLDRIAEEIQTMDPEMALAIDRVSDRLDGKGDS